ncbi:MAG: MoaD/ThiS family protein [Fibrobacterota bacterium]
MNLTLEYLAQIKQAAGKSSETILTDETATLGSVLLDAANRLGSAFSSLVFNESRHFRSSLLIMINDEQVEADLRRALKPNDRVTLLSPMSGG